HLMVLNLHHIIADAWSMRVFIREISECYRAFGGGGPADLPALAVQYADYACWQRTTLTEGRMAQDVQYWRTQLEGAPQALDLPLDRPHPAGRGNRGAVVRTRIERGLHDRLEAYANGRGASLFQVVLAAYATLLHRFSGQDDLVVGVPVAARDHPDAAPLIGFFVNTLPVRVAVADDPTFDALVQRVRETVQTGLKHLHAPLERIVEALDPPRSLAHSPLFQTMFGLQPAPTAAITSSDVDMHVIDVHNGTSKFDLIVLMESHEDGIDAPWEFNTDVLDAATVQRMADCLTVLLEAVVADADRPVSRLRLLAAAERRHLLEDHNDTAVPYPSSLLDEQFRLQARATPDLLAVRYGDTALTYAQLDARSDAVAAALRDAGVTPRQPVGACGERGVALVVGLLGIVKAGGCYVPLSPSDPAERLATMVADSGVAVVLADPAHHRMLRATASALQLLALEAPPPAAGDPRPPVDDIGRDAEDPLYVMYTSGSTGRPKGVVVPHRAVSRLVHGQHDLDFERGLAIAQVANVAFDAFTMELWGAVLHGGCLVGVDRETLLEPAALARQFRDDGIGLAFLTASLFNQVARTHPTAFAAMDTLLVGGEALDPRWMRAVLDSGGPPRRLLNGYGPTETTTFAATHLISHVPHDAVDIPIGRPLANTRLYVLDRWGEPVPVGVRGELHIGGDGLATGYHNRPELTAERFVADPFVGGDARMYRTGDVASTTADGLVRFHGREDGQVKIRGHRIELGEVEHALASAPGVADGVVTAQRVEAGHLQLVGHVVPDGDPPPTVAALRRHMSGRVPDYMVPAVWVVLEQMPTTPTGKLDRSALPMPAAEATGAPQTRGEAPSAAGSGAEALLAGIWQDVLGIAHVTRDDNFFALGGDSIQTIQVVARAGGHGLHLTPRQVFATQTLAELAAVAGPEAVAAEQGLVTGEVPLTPIQRWLFEEEPAAAGDVSQAVWLLVAPDVDAVALERALQTMPDRHDALRLRYRQGEAGLPTQFHQDPDDVGILQTADVSGLSGAARTSRIASLGTRLSQDFDLAEGPLLRALLLRTGADSPARLVLAAHHLVVDGVSWRILIGDLVAAYRDAVRSLPPDPSPKTTSFKQWALHLQDQARGDAIREEAGWWASALAGAPHAAAPTSRLAVHRIGYDAEETARALTAPHRAYGMGLHELLLAALAQTLTTVTGQPTSLIDVEGHGREDAGGTIDLSRTVGWFTALHPLAIEVPATAGPRETLLAAKEAVRAVPGGGIGWGLLRYCSDPDTAAAMAALPRAAVAFNHLGQLDSGAAGTGLVLGLAPEAPDVDGPLSHGLDVVSQVVDGRLAIRCAFAAPQWRADTAGALVATLDDAVRRLAAHCEAPDAGGYSPSDFPEAALDQNQLDDVVAQLAAAGIQI
ncbi:MAG TPA: amino acid adenylation domain-containing protein, partial [Euzebya sp.]|nr:amino acid adenylation domain-containing protein [Euzebya sp.]